MKIMHVVLNLNIGGLEKLVCDMAQLQSKNGKEVIICSLEPEQASSIKLNGNGFKVIYLKRRAGKDFRLLFNLCRLFWREKPYIVHTHNRVPLVYGALAKVFTKIPILVNTCHGEEVICKPRFFWNKYDFIVTISHSAKDRLLEYNRIDKEKVKVIHNGIDVSRFNGLGKNGLKSDKNGKFIVGTVTRLDSYKDIPNLIFGFQRVLNYFKDVELWIVGDGPIKKRLKGLVESLDIKEKVKFWGWQDDIVSINKMMDVFVLPSITEGISIALLEAMACSRPVIVTCVGGNPEVILDGVTGLLVPPKDPNKIADAIIKVLSNKGLAKKIGEAGRKRVEEYFNLERMVKEYEVLYKNCMGKR